MAQITIIAPARLHFGLLDLANTSHRRYGGLGLMIDAFHTKVRATRASATRLSAAIPLDNSYHVAVQGALRRLLARHRAKARVQILEVAQPHSGLGSKTSLLLSSLYATTIALGLPEQPIDLQRLSGRGGASGIGINGFFRGGFVLDGGHPRSSAQFQPSSATRTNTIPPVLCSLQFPEWHIWLLYPKHRTRYIDGQLERTFFAQHTPIPPKEVHRATCIGLLGIAAAIATADFDAFRESLTEFQQVGFKRREVLNQPGAARYLRLLQKQGFAAGMSSLGPLLFAVGTRRDDMPRLDDAIVHGPFYAANQGARVHVGST